MSETAAHGTAPPAARRSGSAWPAPEATGATARSTGGPAGAGALLARARPGRLAAGGRTARRLAPGLLVVAAVAAASFGVNRLVPSVSPLIWAMLLGAAAAPAVRRRGGATAEPGVGFAARRLLRIGVALLGLRVSAGDLVQLGPRGAAIAAGTLAVTLAGTILVGRALRVERRLSLLIATGTAICGASAIAAMNAVARAEDEDAAYAVATVTVFGTLAMLLLPLAAVGVLGLGPTAAGLWAGASIHEVAQVAGAGAAISPLALKLATLVKLGRVVLLAPAIAVAGVASGGGRGARGPLLPGFVVAFLALVAARSVLPLPAELIDAATTASTVLLAAALAGLGLQIRPAALRAAGLRPLALGLAAWLLAAAAALALVLALTG